MNTNIRYPLLLLALTFLTLPLPVEAADKGGDWVRIPNRWLIHRFVRPSTAPARTYRVAVAVPPGSKNPKIAQSSGNSDIDTVAGDYALDLARTTASLRDLAKTKELYFLLTLSPPAIDVKMRSEEGKRPIPADKELSTPTLDTFYVKPNQNETTSRRGEMVVIFPPSGGYASEVIITITTGNPTVDRYNMYAAALNWQTSRKSSKEQILRLPFGASAPQRWHSINDR